MMGAERMQADVSTNGTRIVVDCRDGGPALSGGRTVEWRGHTYDTIATYTAGRAVFTITRRDLENGDRFLYFEAKAPRGATVDIQLGSVLSAQHFDALYRKPAFDRRYGRVRNSGPFGYLTLGQGSAFVSQIYHYDRLEKHYPNGGTSTIYRLVRESANIEPTGKGSLRFRFRAGGRQAAFFLLLSDTALVADETRLDAYMAHYYETLANNGVWCSFFMLPSGTLTKLPLSIEPFTPNGYGYSLQHSSRKDMITFYRQSKERFFDDFITNAVLQTYLYQPQRSGVFCTGYTASWLKREADITAPYIDTRLNENFIRMLRDFQTESGAFPDLNPEAGYLGFLCRYAQEGGNLYHAGDGIFFPDYFGEKTNALSKASLNHQLGIASMLLQSHQQHSSPLYLILFHSMLAFLDATAAQWVNPATGDLFYGVGYAPDGTLQFMGKDYVYVTLLDLMILQQTCIEVPGVGRIPVLDTLAKAKVDFLRRTDHNIFDSAARPAPGESTYSRDQAERLYRRLYDNV